MYICIYIQASYGSSSNSLSVENGSNIIKSTSTMSTGASIPSMSTGTSTPSMSTGAIPSMITGTFIPVMSDKIDVKSDRYITPICIHTYM
jgi:hypothetical protein